MIFLLKIYGSGIKTNLNFFFLSSLLLVDENLILEEYFVGVLETCNSPQFKKYIYQCLLFTSLYQDADYWQENQVVNIVCAEDQIIINKVSSRITMKTQKLKSFLKQELN